MANTYRVTHCFQGSGGTTQDMYCNQFYFFCTAHAPGDVATWGPTLASKVHLLWATGGSPPALWYWYSGRCTNNLGVTKIYDVTGNPETAGAPIFTITDSTLVPAGYLEDHPTDTANLPEEVAVCLSYQAVHTDGDLPRRRGRIYLGPLNVLAIDTTVSDSSPTRVSATMISRILANAVTMQNSAATDDFEWRVFSTMDGFAFKIVTFSVDNAFDTVRGRGCAPSDRTELAIT